MSLSRLYLIGMLIITLLVLLIPKQPSSAQQEDCAIDLMLALDGSGSISQSDFTLMKDFVRQFVSALPIGPNGANVGIIQFADTAELYLEISQDQNTILTRIDHMTQLGRRTDIAGAIKLAQAQFMTRRAGTPRVIVILTDGVHTMAGSPIAQADIARAEGTTIIGIGVGNFDLSELIAISGGDANLIRVGSFQELTAILETLTNSACTAPIVPVAPPVASVPTTAPIVATPAPIVPTTAPVVITSTSIVVGSAPTREPIAPPVAGPKDTQIAFASDRDGDFEIFVMDGDGGNVRQLTFNESNDNKPAWSKDGRMLAWESDDDGDFEIWAMNADGSNQHKLTDNNAGDWGPAWSPDNSQVAFHSNRSGGTSIFVMNADGGDPHKITNSGADAIDQSAAWSPDGQELVYYSDKSGGRELYRVNIKTGAEYRLSENEYYDGSPDWSSAGDLVVFGSARLDGNAEIWIMDADGKNAQRLTEREGVDDDPVWSPDNQHIAFESESSGNFEIWVMNADGSGLQQLTNDPATDWSVDWMWKP